MDTHDDLSRHLFQTVLLIPKVGHSVYQLSLFHLFLNTVHWPNKRTIINQKMTDTYDLTKTIKYNLWSGRKQCCDVVHRMLQKHLEHFSTKEWFLR